MLLYSEYQSLVDTLEKSKNHEFTYQELMQKEEKVLDTVNKVIRNYKDEEHKEREFINKRLIQIAYDFFQVWIDMFTEFVDNKDLARIPSIVTKDDRLIYIGVMFVIVSIILYYMKMTE